MFGPAILARTLSEYGPPTSGGLRWQYHSRSDRHSKVASWGVAFDLMLASSLLREHAKQDKVVLGINHRMSDFVSKRSKDLDLVIARPAGPIEDANPQTLVSLVDKYGIELLPEEADALQSLPELTVGPVGSVLVAMEAKAAMTAHGKAQPRLYDELSSSHLCIHGESQTALAIGYVQVNVSDQFISSNPKNVTLMTHGLEPDVSIHKQPADTLSMMNKLSQLRTRADSSGVGFDALGVTVLKMVNDGTPVEIVNDPPAPAPGAPFHYATMIMRMATRYDTQFRGI